MGFEKTIRTCRFRPGAEDNIVLLTPCKPPLTLSFRSHLQCFSSTTISPSKPTSVFLSVAYISVVLSHSAVFLLKATLSLETPSLSLKWLKYPVCHCRLILFQFVKQLVTSISDSPLLQLSADFSREEDPASVNHTGALLQNWHFTEANNLAWNKSIHE